ncbi:MAG: Stp1/IreP family PP2C-type Ser/Thr phosphatase [Clostridia bacterium]|nr:Stp1/IreP family PP2C-type Ser/Thr phosphatase [Clostridia bacterium]
MRFYGLTDVGVKRENNEDSISLPSENDGIKLFILADGMGGAKAGEKASQLAIKTIRDYIRLNFIKIERTKEEIAEIIRKAMVEANKQVFELSMEYKEFSGMGTTVVVVLIYRGTVYIGHIGDSRVYRLRQSILRQLTKDHSYVQELVRQGSITIEEAKNHPQKNVLLKALGCDRDIVPDVITKGFVKGDILLLCSDGLTNMVDDKKIFEIIMKNTSDLKVACKMLIDTANDNGGVDNVSAIIISSN